MPPSKGGLRQNGRMPPPKGRLAVYAANALKSPNTQYVAFFWGSTWYSSSLIPGSFLYSVNFLTSSTFLSDLHEQSTPCSWPPAYPPRPTPPTLANNLTINNSLTNTHITATQLQLGTDPTAKNSPVPL